MTQRLKRRAIPIARLKKVTSHIIKNNYKGQSSSYYIVSYVCDDARLRYTTGIRGDKDLDRSEKSLLESIIARAQDYVSWYRKVNKPVLKEELKKHLDEEFKPEVEGPEGQVETPEEAPIFNNTFVEDHKAMIAGMRNGEILKQDGGVYSKNTADQYERMCELWLRCEADTKNGDPEKQFTLSYMIDADECKKLRGWLTKKNYSKNAIYDAINVLKIFLKWSNKAGKHSFKHHETIGDFLHIKREVADTIAPSFEEIYNLYKYKFDNPNFERARDFFVLGCFLALRVNDLRRINDYYLVQDTDGSYYFDVFTQKGLTTVRIPAHWIAREIYNKYRVQNITCEDETRIPKQWRKYYIKGRIPTYHKNNLAEYLEKICPKVITGKKLIRMTKGGVTTATQYERWQLITPHTMRRFFATYTVVELRLSPDEIIKITGHKNRDTLLNYIKVDEEALVRKMSQLPAFVGPVESASNLSVAV